MLHLIIPAITLFAFYNRDYLKWFFILSPLTQVQAIDHLAAFYSIERAMLHNVFILVPFVVIALISYIRGHKTLTNVMVISVFYWASHIILDLDGVKALWPFSDTVYRLNTRLFYLGRSWYVVEPVTLYILLVFILGFIISLPNIRKELTTIFSKKRNGVNNVPNPRQ